MFWPYRLRQGYPAAPAWLVVLLIIGAVVAFFALPILTGELLYHVGLGLAALSRCAQPNN